MLQPAPGSTKRFPVAISGSCCCDAIALAGLAIALAGLVIALAGLAIALAGLAIALAGLAIALAGLVIALAGLAITLAGLAIAFLDSDRNLGKPQLLACSNTQLSAQKEDTGYEGHSSAKGALKSSLIQPMSLCKPSTRPDFC